MNVFDFAVAAARLQAAPVTMKHYLNNLICECAPENGFAQDAIEFAVVSDFVKLTGDWDADVRAIMSQYDAICEAWRRVVNKNPEEELAA